MPRIGRVKRLGVVVLVAAMVLMVALSWLPSVTPTTASQATSIAWRPCGSYHCGTLTVPLDHAAPDGATTTLSVKRRPATASPRIGTLFVNPGGPGGSGTQMVEFVETAGLERYDIVGWDPRGVSAASAVECLNGKAADAYLELDASPDTPEERDALAAGARDFAAACLANTGADLLSHISTVDTVRDLDLLREAVGDDQVHFLGVSYGTQIGAVYAHLFPQRAGRLVLDAAVDITDSRTVPQTLGFDRALGNFAQWCARTPTCGLGDTPDAVIAGLRADLDALDAAPVAVGDRRLTQTLAATGLAAYFYSGDDAWPILARSVKGLRQGDGTSLLRLADQLNSREADGSYGGLFSAFPAISCLDAKPIDLAEADRQWQDDQAKAPFFGHYLGPWYTCTAWPVPSSPLTGVDGQGAPPILVIGATGDPATPYEWAELTASALESAVLLTFDGEGHGAYGGRSECVDAAVRAFLVDGVVPAAGTRCS